MEFTKEEIRARKLTKLENQLADRTDSLVKAMNLIQALDDADALDNLTALINRKDDALYYFVKEANKPRYSKVFENMEAMLFLLGDLEVERVREFTSYINAGLEQAEAGLKENSEKTSYFDLVKALRDPHVNRSITLILNFLKGMGQHQPK